MEKTKIKQLLNQMKLYFLNKFLEKSFISDIDIE